MQSSVVKPLQLSRHSVDSQSANGMLRKAAVVGTFEVANGECVVRLSNVTSPHASSSTCPTARDGETIPVPKPETVINGIQNGTVVVHESKRNITKKQLAVHINYLQKGANVARGASGVWNNELQEKLNAWFLKAMKGWKQEPLLALTDDPNHEERKRKRTDDDRDDSKTKATSSASTSPALTPNIDKPVASSSSSSSSGSEEQSESEEAESDSDASTSSDGAQKPRENIALDDDQKPSENKEAAPLDDVYQLELEVDGWDGDWLDAWRSAAWLFDKRTGGSDDKKEIIANLLREVHKAKMAWDAA